MVIQYTNDTNEIQTVVTGWQIILNPILALFNIAIVTCIDDKTRRVVKLNKIHWGQLFTNRWNIIGNYKMYYYLIKYFGWV